MDLISKINSYVKNKGRFYWTLREWYVILYCKILHIFDVNGDITSLPLKNKKRLLFYHINSLGFAGTEKFLQILAKYIDKNKYDVFFMYPEVQEKNNFQRLEYIKKGNVQPISFKYKNISITPPYYVSGMSPDIFKIIKKLKIDLLVTPGSGHANYPFSIIKNIPILLLNIFGQPNIQNNITHHICISQEVANKLTPIVPLNKIKVLPVPSEGPSKKSFQAGEELRKRFNINENDFIFGRIGRPDDGIFDEIGIKAFQKVVKKYPNTHYLIMAPMPKLKKIVSTEKIPNIHFLEPSSREEDVWAFHQALDTMAHFRYDGESFGLNIAESMLCAKPVITHKSPIWNAHLEYLEPSFSRVAEIGNVEQYASFMEEFIQKKQSGQLKLMGVFAKTKAEKLFLIENNIKKFENWIDESLEKFYGTHSTH